MFMEIVLYDNQGIPESMNVLRGNIQTELNHGNKVLVKFLQPGATYEKDGNYFSVVDYMNEWAGKPVSFQSNLVPLKKCEAKFTYTNDMFFTGPKLYQKNKMCIDLLSKLLPVHEKQTDKHWDLLLGEASDNKDLLHQTIKNHPVLDKTFLTYFGKDTTKGYWSDDVVRPKKHTAETLGPLANRFKTQIRCSDLIDPAIYNQTHYTAMIETTIHNDFAMFSEKEAKPIVAQRPFVIFGAWRQLEAFRSLGFKTFFEVIDESYDIIEDKTQRWRKALDSMMALTEHDPVDVYAKLKDVLAHNKNHFENTDWQRCLTWDSYQ
tara:strand:- start:686 stop:1645 length:960 start_codon:yes stop_codon:yes gene_type:complete